MSGRRAPRQAKPEPARACPICGEPADAAHYPFCSRRCKAIDLNRWLSGRYVIPGADDESAGPGEDET
jgi:endogenous inhibitor of DNA gyrase (YacG/DUF329 family)